MHQIEQLVERTPGWSPIDELLALFTLVYASAHMPGDVIEIGAWCGRSSVAMALAAVRIGKTRVHSIDLFPERSDWHRNIDGTYSISVTVGETTFRACDEQTVWREPFERDILPVYERGSTFDIFSQAIAENGVSDIVKPFKGTSTSFVEQHPSVACKLAFIDGDHGYQAVSADIRNVEKLLVPGGWLCLDDAFTSNKGIDCAIRELVLDNPAYDSGQQFTRKLFVARKL